MTDDTKPPDGQAFRDLLGKLVQVPKKEADRRAKLERQRRQKRRKPKQ